jgi:RNA recognition motif-containing protein
MNLNSYYFFVINSLEKYDENKLIELFSSYGEIIQARVIRDQSTESPRGIAFVIMGTRSQAQRAGKNKKFFFVDKI